MKQAFVMGLAVALVWAAPATARRIASEPVSTRTARSDVVLVGKVSDIEDKTVKTKDGAEYKVASVKIVEGLLGAKGLTHVKVGFFPGGRGRTPSLQAGQEVCLFLQAVPGENIHVAPMFFDVVDKQNPNYDKEVTEARKYATLIEKADENLKARDADTRFRTAALLIARYRTARTGEEKPTPIDATRSKLILEALRDADWNRRADAEFPITPFQAFNRLGLQKTDGWVLDPSGNPMQAAQKWLEENAGKYRIQGLVGASK